MPSACTSKQAWVSHLMESLQMWSQQLQDYTQQQATLSEREGKAMRDINAATRAIQDLNAKAGGNSISLPAADFSMPVAETSADPEEENMKTKLQHLFKDCAKAAGLKITKDGKDESMVETIQSDDDGQDGPKGKRARSQDPSEPPAGGGLKEPPTM